MKSVTLFAVAALLTSCSSVPVRTSRVEVFKAECTVALTNHVRVWRVSEVESGLILEYEVTKHGTSSSVLKGDDATAVRGRLNAMRWFQSEDEALRLGPPGASQLRPFDGNYYRFTVQRMGAVRRYERDNPWFDLQQMPESANSIALKELLEFLDLIENLATRRNA